MRMITRLTACAAHWRAVRARRVATRELAAMSVCELSDMGITRLDVSRLFEPSLLLEFRARGGASRVAAAGTFKPILLRSAVMTSLDVDINEILFRLTRQEIRKGTRPCRM